MIHLLKILPEYFAAVLSGEKTFEIRNTDDRDFSCGDHVWLEEFDGWRHTGRRQRVAITYITDFMQQPGYVVFGFARMDDPRNCAAMPNA